MLQNACHMLKKKTKQNKTKRLRKKKKLHPPEVELETFDIKWQGVIHCATTTFDLIIVFKIFLPWYSAGGRCL